MFARVEARPNTVMRWATLASFRASLLCVAVLLAFATAESSAFAQDRFDGAIWSFTMSSKKPGGESLSGRFRVSDDVLYQKVSPQARGFRKVIGKNTPNGRRTRIEMEDFRAMNGQGSWQTGLQGKALLTMDRFGEWSGTFIKSDGSHWDFRCVRVQE